MEISLKQRLLNYAPKNSRNLKPDAVPTLRLPGKDLRSEESHPRSERLAKRRRKNEVSEILASCNVLVENSNLNIEEQVENQNDR